MEYISDLPDETLVTYLTKEDGFKLTKTFSEFLIAQCGTRFRILHNVLESNSNEADRREMINQLYGLAAFQLNEFLKLTGEYPEIVKFLSDLCVEKQHLSKLPEKLQRQESISKVLYVGPNPEVTFQNKIIENLVRLRNK
jgi:hypothetical protein